MNMVQEAQPFTAIYDHEIGPRPAEPYAALRVLNVRAQGWTEASVENVAGGSGSIGVGRVARAAPDGYVLVMGNLSTHVVNGAVYPLAYDLVRDFEPIALIGKTPWFFTAKKDLPANNLREMIAWLKENPDKATVGFVVANAAVASDKDTVVFHLAEPDATWPSVLATASFVVVSALFLADRRPGTPGSVVVGAWLAMS